MSLVEVICDTSFLILLATKRIKNISKIDTEIGQLKFVVPTVVKNELQNLTLDPKKEKDAIATLNYIKNFKKIGIEGNFADRGILEHIKIHGGIVATTDKELKNKIKTSGGSVLSISNNRIVLEPS